MNALDALKAEAERRLLNHQGGDPPMVEVDAQAFLDLHRTAQIGAEVKAALRAARSRNVPEDGQLWDERLPAQQAIENLLKMAGLTVAAEPRRPDPAR